MLREPEEKKQALLGVSAFILGLFLILLQRWILASRAISFINVSPLTREAYAEEIFTPPAIIIFSVCL
jgi:hypothetical protein